MTPVACAEMVTGVAADRHWISGMNWYHRLERRYVEYGSSLEATRSVGVFRALYDLVYNMNLAHLSPEVPTLFETLDDAGARTACTPFLIYRGRHRHQVSLEGLMKRTLVDAGRLKFDHHTWGPRDLFYGDLYASREVPCKSTSIPGNRDIYAGCCAAELAKEDGFDFLLLSLPDNDNHSHRHGPEASGESIAKADESFAQLVDATGGIDRFLEDHAVILVADHSHSDVDRGLPLADLLAQEWTVLQPSEDRPEQAQLAVSPTGRAAHVYLLPANGDTADHGEVSESLAATEGVDLVCWLESRDGTPLPRLEAGVPTGEEVWAVVERGGSRMRFRPGGGRSPTCAAPGGTSRGTHDALAAVVEDGRLRSERYPDPLARVFSALSAPHAGDLIVSLELGYEALDWGGASHAGGGSHGSLLATTRSARSSSAAAAPRTPASATSGPCATSRPPCLASTSGCEAGPPARRRAALLCLPASGPRRARETSPPRKPPSAPITTRRSSASAASTPG